VQAATGQALVAVGGTGDGRDGGTEEDEARRARERFRRRVARGSYAGLFAPKVRAVLEEAARAEGLEEELGALRYALARLIEEEPEAWRLARETARLATAAATLAKARRALGADASGDLTALLADVLMGLDTEDKARVDERQALGGGDRRALGSGKETGW
jgi:hypothetical protein